MGTVTYFMLFIATLPPNKVFISSGTCCRRIRLPTVTVGSVAKAKAYYSILFLAMKMKRVR